MLNKEINLLLNLYEKMLLIRKFEEKVSEMSLDGKIPGSVHLCIGEEAIPVGTILNLDKKDYILPTHRGHGQILLKGTLPKILLSEIMGKETGCCKGRSGSMHIFDKENNVLGSQGIVGAQLPISIGAGLALKLKKTKNCVVVFFGDGSTNQGWFYESLNLASLWELPIIFVCINNHYGMGTNYKNTSKAKIFKKPNIFNIDSKCIDGNDAEKIYYFMKEAINKTKEECKPKFVECNTYRLTGHSAFDFRNYRPEKEFKKWAKKDPIKIIKRRILKHSEGQNFINKIEMKIENEIINSEDFASNSKYPSINSLKEF